MDRINPEQPLPHATSTPLDLEAIFLAQRTPLVRFCSRITRRPDIAEDLVQETLITAWQQIDTLREREAIRGWIFGIARHVCARWLRRHGREQAHLDLPAADLDPTAELAADADVEVELERDELATLLDQALALLPAEARAILLQKYVEESPHAEIARRLGLSEGAVAMRLQRGRLALRRVLLTELGEQAHAFGLVADQGEGWAATRVWCPFCGHCTLVCRSDPATDHLQFCCPERCLEATGQITQTKQQSLVAGLRSHKAMLSRQIAYLNTFYRQGIDQHAAACLLCGQLMRVETRLPDDVPPEMRSWHGLLLTCPACGWRDVNPLYHLALDLPATQQFWRAHPRMRVQPERVIEVGGRPAVLTTFESMRDPARLDILTDRATLAVLDTTAIP